MCLWCGCTLGAASKSVISLACVWSEKIIKPVNLHYNSLVGHFLITQNPKTKLEDIIHQITQKAWIPRRVSAGSQICTFHVHDYLIIIRVIITDMKSKMCFNARKPNIMSVWWLFQHHPSYHASRWMSNSVHNEICVSHKLPPCSLYLFLQITASEWSLCQEWKTRCTPLATKSNIAWAA